MRVFILSRTQNEILEEMYPQLVRAGADVVGFATPSTGSGRASTDGLDEQIQAIRPDLLLVNMTVSRRGEEAAFLEGLNFSPLALILPQGRRTSREELEGLACVAAVGVEPVDCGQLLAAAAGGQAAGEPQAAEPPPEASSREEPPSPPNPKPAAPPASGSPPAPAPPPAQLSLMGDGQPAPSPVSSSAGQGRIIAFTGGTLGGTGKSTLAGALAWALAHQAGVKTLLLGLDNPAGAASHLKLGRWPHLGLFLAGEKPLGQVVHHTGDLAVAVAPGDLAAYDEIGGRLPDEAGAVDQAVGEAAGQYELVVADLPPNVGGWAVHPLLRADDVVIVARPTVADQAGVVQVLTMLEALRPQGQGPAVHLVINDRDSRDIDAGAFVAGVEQIVSPCPPVVATIGHSPVVRLAQNEGLPLARAEGTDGLLKGIRRLAQALGYQWQTEEEKEEETVQVEPAGEGRPDQNGKPRQKKGWRLPVQIKLVD